MTAIRFVSTLCLGLLSATGAQAACDTGRADAKGMPYAGDATSQQGVSLSIIQAFSGVAYLHVKNMTLKAPDCTVATFSIANLTYTLTTNDMATAPRGARGNGSAAAWLLATLRPEDAAKASRALSTSLGAGSLTLIKLQPEDLIYVLVTGTGDKAPWSVYGIYDHIPDTPRLAQVMCQAVLGSLPVAAVYDPKDKSVTVKDATAYTHFDDIGRDGGPCTVTPVP